MHLSEIEIRDLQEHYAGYCTSCDEVTCDGGVEPDAENYRCPDCGKNSVMGIDNALIIGAISVVQEKYSGVFQARVKERET